MSRAIISCFQIEVGPKSPFPTCHTHRSFLHGQAMEASAGWVGSSLGADLVWVLD